MGGTWPGPAAAAAAAGPVSAGPVALIAPGRVSAATLAGAGVRASVTYLPDLDVSRLVVNPVQAARALSVLARHSPPVARTASLGPSVPGKRGVPLPAAVSSVPGVDAAVHADDVTPSNRLWPDEWGFDKDGFAGAWSVTTGTAVSPVVVAVIDTGVSPNADLGGRLLAGYNELDGTTNTADDNGHGTAVADLIASAGNTSAGIAGGCWSCRILPVKALDSTGSGTVGQIAAGITWATDHGASVINLSLGGPADPQGVLAAALQYAASRGVVAVAAAGNAGSTTVSYPAAYNDVISVAATDAANTLYSWSNRGPWVDVAAPGCATTDFGDGAGQIDGFCGTSAATPFVSGLAGLVQAVAPGATWGTHVADIERGMAAVVPAGSIAGGEINAASAVGGVAPSPVPSGAGAPTTCMSPGDAVVSGVPWVLAATSDAHGCPGYWIATGSGEVVPFGSARSYGSAADTRLRAPIVGMAATPDGGGYWLLGADGGIFAFGDAAFHGSTGGMDLGAPVVAMASTPDGQGYWLVASDGGIFAFGDARFHGSTGAETLNRPVAGMTADPDGGAYRLVAADGGVFSFGAPFYGSLGAHPPTAPVTTIASSPDGLGYYMVSSDGAVFAFGDASFLGRVRR